MGRAMRALQAFNACKADYDAAWILPEGSPEQEAALSAAHAKGAESALSVARLNGGIYNKAAQLVASLGGGAGDKGVPRQYVETLSVLTGAVSSAA